MQNFEPTGAAAAMPGSAVPQIKRRLVISACLLIPLFYLGLGAAFGLPLPPFLTGDNAMWCLVQEVQHYGDEAADLQANKTTLAPAGYDWVVQDAYDLQKKGESGGIITPIFSKAVQATTEYSADLNSLWQEAYVDCVTCSPDEFESKYEEYCQEYLDAGYQEILDEKASLIADGNVLVVK